MLNGDLSAHNEINENLLANTFWSSTEINALPGYFWNIDFDLGPDHEERVYNCYHELLLRVRLVRNRDR